MVGPTNRSPLHSNSIQCLRCLRSYILNSASLTSSGSHYIKEKHSTQGRPRTDWMDFELRPVVASTPHRAPTICGLAPAHQPSSTSQSASLGSCLRRPHTRPWDAPGICDLSTSVCSPTHWIPNHQASQQFRVYKHIPTTC